MRSRRILLVVVMLVAPAMLAGATHNFGHRLYILGRVIDANGLPVSDVQIEGEIQGLEVETNEGPCRTNPCTQSVGETQPQQPVPLKTDQLGDYAVSDYGRDHLYWHAHGIDEDGTAEITVEGETFSAPYDTERRWTVINAQLSKTVPHDNATVERWERSYTIRGRLWVPDGGLPGSGTTWVEGNVPGCMEEYGGGQRCLPVPVNITLDLDDGRQLEETTQTAAGYGDFWTTIEADEPILGGQATVTAGGQEWSFNLDMQRRATIRVFELPAPESAGFPIVPVLGGIGLVAGGVGAYVGIQRWQDRREMQRAREQSGRKRSN